jgi:SurA N-terminal domain
MILHAGEPSNYGPLVLALADDAKDCFSIARLTLQTRAIGVAIATAAVVVVVAMVARADTQDWRVAVVGTQPITASLYRHWEHIDHRVAPHESAKQRRTTVMRFLIAGFWIIGEAQERGIRVSDKQVDRELERTRRAAFRTERSFKRFLRRTGQTVADMKFRTRIDLLTRKLQAVVDPGDFASKWRTRTLCAPGFTVTDCGGTLTG